MIDLKCSNKQSLNISNKLLKDYSD